MTLFSLRLSHSLLLANVEKGTCKYTDSFLCACRLLWWGWGGAGGFNPPTVRTATLRKRKDCFFLFSVIYLLFVLDCEKRKRGRGRGVGWGTEGVVTLVHH